MSVEISLEPPQSIEATRSPWSPASRIAFRFCFVYFGLYCLGTQIINSVLAVPKIDVPDWGTLWPIRPLVFWIGAHLFGAKLPLVYSGSGSGDKVYDWVLMFCMLVASVVATAVWTTLDRKHTSYPKLFKWFFIFLRFCLASQMFTYGLIKIFPLQMGALSLSTMLEPFGNLSPMGVLWSSVSASPAYETFAGCAEFLGGALLVFPRTTTLGALVCLVDMVQVFTLNMTYDVPVKLLSFHLILFSLFMLAPEGRRLLNFFILNRPAERSLREPLLASQRARRFATITFMALWLWMLACNAYGAWESWHKYGPGMPKAPLYGLWNVEQYSVDGQPRPLLISDDTAWRRLLFEYPGYVGVQRMNEKTTYYAGSVSLEKKTISLTDETNKSWKANFAILLPTPDTMDLDGAVDGHHTSLRLRRFDSAEFPLKSRGFHWVQDYPFNE